MCVSWWDRVWGRAKYHILHLWLSHLEKDTANVLKFCTSNLSDKNVYANSAEPDQTAPQGAV